MGTKRDKRRLQFRARLEQLTDLYMINPEEFTQIVESKGEFELCRIPGPVLQEIRSLFNKLVYQ